MLDVKDLVQGSDEWHKWRAEGIGSSHAPIIMGVSPWKTPLQLYEWYASGSPKEESNFAIERGRDLEPVARAQYEMIHDCDMPPATLVHPEHSFLRASLDGYSAEKKIILEIKCPGREDHAVALSKKIPGKYYAQLQHQMLVSGAEVVHYYSFDGAAGVLVEVARDEDYIEELLKAETLFWERVVSRNPPPLSERDYIEETDYVNLENIQEWRRKKHQVDLLEKDMEELRDHITGRLTHNRVKAFGVKIQKIFKKGSVDYSKIPELKSIDLDKFRKPSSEYYAFSIEKGS